jgi:ubiquitin carboxyl-terminal hydrolase 34
MMSGEEGSYSSRMSNKSEKNMADFDGEESGCDDELVQLAAQVLSEFLSSYFCYYSRQ